MANNPYVNKVIYGNDTIIDLTLDTLTASKLHAGYTAHDRSGNSIIGQYSPPVITNVSFNQLSPTKLTAGVNYKSSNDGYAVSDYAYIYPNNLPTALASHFMYRFRSEHPSDIPQVVGYLIKSYDSKTPDDTTPPSVSSGEIVLMGGAGYLYATQQTGGVLYTKTGTIPTFTSINQEQTIDTGLSEVKYVLIEGVSSNNNYINQTVLNMDRSFGKQVTLIVNSSGQVTSLTSGSTASGLITGTSNTLKISNISGGSITVKGATNVNYLQKDIVWYAG